MTCAGWLEQLATGSDRLIVNLRPTADWPDTDNVPIDQARVVRILRRVAGDVGELARARRLADLASADVDADTRLGHRRQLAEPPIAFPKGPKSVLHLRQAWEDYERRLRQAGLPTPQDPWRHLSPSRDRSAEHRAERPGANSAVPDASSGLKTATVLLWLRVENNSKFVRGKKRAREDIERYHLQRYAAERRASGEYELKVPFRDDKDLDTTMDDLFRAIANEAEVALLLHGAFCPRRRQRGTFLVSPDVQQPTRKARTAPRAALYIRVSSDKQTAKNQVAELRQLAHGRGYAPIVYEEIESAAKVRPAFNRMLADGRAGPTAPRC